jgi:hypothetical protein
MPALNKSSAGSSPRVGLTRESLEGFTGNAPVADPISLFLDTPLEEYPVDLELLREVSNSLSFPAQNGTRRYSPYKSRGRAKSVHSGHSSGSSASSRGSRRSRRGVRRWNIELPSVALVGSFYCTFCPKSFSTQFEWTRHEESVHMPRTFWVCNPLGVPGSVLAKCHFCRYKNPDVVHMSSHNVPKCMIKPIVDRTFSRFDHLLQHIKQSHNPRSYIQNTSFRNWVVPAEPLPENSKALKCGYCGKQFPEWETRRLQIASHYREGVDPSQWWLSRKDNTPTRDSYNATPNLSNPRSR